MFLNLTEISNSVFLIDCVSLMKQIPSNSIAGCVTDPPYNYEFFGHKWNNQEIQRRLEIAKKNPKILVKNIPYGSGLSGGVRNARWRSICIYL